MDHSGNTITNWLFALHMGTVFGLPYRILACALGLVVAMLSGTGVYIWWKERKSRKFSATRASFVLGSRTATMEAPAE